MENKKSYQQPPLGRNIYSLFIVLLVLIQLVFDVMVIIVIINYTKTYNDNKLLPFVDETKEQKFAEGSYEKEIKRMKGSQFKDFGISFQCTNYSEEENNQTASYELRVYKNENSKTLSGQMEANVCIYSKWVGFISYATKTSTLEVASDLETAKSSTRYRKSFTVRHLIDYPAKAKIWPVSVTVDEPTAYLYLAYSYSENGKLKKVAYVLEYSYKELIGDNFTGGIRK